MPLEAPSRIPHCRARTASTNLVQQEVTMTSRLVGILAAAFAIGVPYAVGVQATDAVGFTGKTIASGTFDEINVFNSVIPPEAWRGWLKSDVWLSWQKTKGRSDLYIQSNTWEIGGTTGWHSHPGHSLIIITSGIVTDYESDGRHCTAKVYDATVQPQTLVDSGGDHIHQIVNTGKTAATGYAVQLIPSGAVRRIGADQPANCPF
jgi:hypothetical protein